MGLALTTSDRQHQRQRQPDTVGASEGQSHTNGFQRHKAHRDGKLGPACQKTRAEAGPTAWG